MIVTGHRGAKGLAPENTVLSLQKALDHHVGELEFDVRVTKDGVPVLHHDKTLSDAAGTRLKLSEHDFSELKDHKPDLPTLEEVIDAFGKQVPLYIEIKPGEDIGPVIAIIKEKLDNGWETEKFLLASFSQKILLGLHKALPEIEKIVIEDFSGVRAQWRARQVKAKRLSMNYRWLWWGFIEAMSHSGYQLFAYTLNDPEKAKRWAKYGLSGIITDFPDRFEQEKGK